MEAHASHTLIWRTNCLPMSCQTNFLFRMSSHDVWWDSRRELVQQQHSWSEASPFFSAYLVLCCGSFLWTQSSSFQPWIPREPGQVHTEDLLPRGLLCFKRSSWWEDTFCERMIVSQEWTLRTSWTLKPHLRCCLVWLSLWLVKSSDNSRCFSVKTVIVIVVNKWPQAWQARRHPSQHRQQHYIRSWLATQSRLPLLLHIPLLVMILSILFLVTQVTSRLQVRLEYLTKL